ncbi:hypothetical protein L207DRAFT_542300 [Hyaloscypha variabilis F]|uniref:DUF3824 domain-containing protein n=1 Tax=Hyaloscypha variabilis (strain UAMH 11265 / GT02V1 / F) TaxID=1149755 RepID=A0A2J6S1J8_HYAVF|nr:hypothetical protein L207DRAFT_542300 [Hyaloscypha variabilis F]
MPEITRERVIYRGGRDRDDDSSDDDRSTFSHSHRESSGGGGYRTVQRYRVTPSRVEPIEDERRTSRTTLLEVGNRRGAHLDIERTSSERIEGPPRPRSAIDIRPRSTIVERYVEREPLREPLRDERSERTRTVVYERDRREPERDRPWERDFGRESERDVRETDVRIEKRVTTERREEPYELERYQRETEYYDREPAPQPIVIRQRAPEPQKIIINEAPAPPPIYLPQPAREEGFQVIRRREEIQEVARPEPRRPVEDEYYYRRDVREVGGPRRSDEDFALTGAALTGAAAVAGPLAVAAYRERREDRRDDRREIHPRDSVSDRSYSDDEDVVVRRKIIKKERSRSRDSHHKRHLAEGALAGAGAAALLANHRSKQGDGPDHRGRNVVGGAALGALGAEVLTRARSRYRDRHDDESRSRSSSRHSHRKIKTGLALAAAGLAAAAAAKYVSNRKANKEEAGRGRSRTRSVSRRRYSDDDDFHDEGRAGRSRSRHADPKHRAASMAKAGVATAAVAGIVEHFRNKSKKRDGSRSKSRIRTGAEIAAAGLAGAGVAGLYENRKAKEEREEEEHEARRERRRSRSRARSVGTYSDPGVDPELGMVQYGTEPVYTHPGYYDPAVAAGAGAAYGATREHRPRSGRRRHSSESSSERGESRKKSRSRSRVRDIAGAAAGTAAAAIGYEEEDSPAEHYYDHNYRDEEYSPSPPHASGGSYYPQNNQFPPPPTGQFTQQPFTQQPMNTQVHPEGAAPIPPYNPADYAGQPAATQNPYPYPEGTGDNLTQHGNRTKLTRSEAPPRVRIYTPPSTASPSPLSSPTPSPAKLSSKSVNFAPLSPSSSRRLAKIHKNAPHTHSPYDPSDPLTLAPSNSNYNTQPQDEEEEETDLVYSSDRPRRRRRRNSDPSSDRPLQTRKHRRRHHNASRSPSPSSSSEVEILPDRFDKDGRPLDRYGNLFNSGARARGVGGQGAGDGQEMVERFTREIGDVIEGKKSWVSLLKDIVGGGPGAGSPGASSEDLSGGKRRRR